MQETQEMQVQSLGWEDPLEKEMATHSSILAWEIPWTEEPGGLQSMGLQRVVHDWVCMKVHVHMWLVAEWRMTQLWQRRDQPGCSGGWTLLNEGRLKPPMRGFIWLQSNFRLLGLVSNSQDFYLARLNMKSFCLLNLYIGPDFSFFLSFFFFWGPFWVCKNISTGCIFQALPQRSLDWLFFFQFYWDITNIQHCVNLRCAA